MKGLIPFIRDNGAGLGTLTIYTGAVLYYFVVHPSESIYVQLVLFFSIGPAIIVYEASKGLTRPIIKRTLEQHVAVVRMELEVEQGGEFDDWYDGDAREEIDELDGKTHHKITSILCCAIIGLTAPLFGYWAFNLLGLGIGLGIFGSAVMVTIHTIRRVAETIERTTKVVET